MDLAYNSFRDHTRWALKERHAERYLDLALEQSPRLNQVLNIGTGRGTFVEVCRRRGLITYGFDVRAMFPYTQGTFIQGDACALPFKNETFDLVFENNLLADMAGLQKCDDNAITSVVREAFRVLKIGGSFLPTITHSPLADIHMKDVCYVPDNQALMYRKIRNSKS